MTSNPEGGLKDDLSDISEPEIISSFSNSNGDSSDGTSKSADTQPPIKDLPQTVTYLTGPNGSQVYIVGTAHFSEESNQDVITTLEKVNPHIVCLELCKNRLHVLKCTEEEILEEVQNIGVTKLRELVSQSGVFYGVFQFVLLHLSSGLTKQLGLAPGGEFRAAYRKGLTLKCRFILIDRSIQTTLKRAVYSLPMLKQIGLAIKLMSNNETITKEDVESFKGDVLQKLIDEISEAYPNLSKIFVDERDQYLSTKIYDAARSTVYVTKPKVEDVASSSKGTSETAASLQDDDDQNDDSEPELLKMRSEESESESEEEEEEEEGVEEVETTKIVAVVGIGHIAGIKNYWGKDIDCEAICVIPEPSTQTKIILKTIKYTLLSLVLYGSYTLVRSLYSILPVCSAQSFLYSCYQKASNFIPPYS